MQHSASPVHTGLMHLLQHVKSRAGPPRPQFTLLPPTLSTTATALCLQPSQQQNPNLLHRYLINPPIQKFCCCCSFCSCYPCCLHMLPLLSITTSYSPSPCHAHSSCHSTALAYKPTMLLEALHHRQSTPDPPPPLLLLLLPLLKLRRQCRSQQSHHCNFPANPVRLLYRRRSCCIATALPCTAAVPQKAALAGAGGCRNP